ncbi:MAG: HAD family hydrolase [Acidimicrobiales bacterium]|nr:HAD family hydrolase [Acidimicrobiales bacterium]
MGGLAVIEVVALDGDDTLWHSEQMFVDTQARFRDLLAPHVDLDHAALDARLLEVERRNLSTLGYGVKAFTLSLIETAIEVTEGRVLGRDVQAIVDLGKALLDHPVQLLDGVPEAVDALTGRYRVMIITKGDLLHQESKVARSGLAEDLWAVEIVSEKDAPTYERVLRRHRIDPASFVMVGNSVRSDVLPVLALGGRAVHVPYHVTWELEQPDHDPADGDFPVLAGLTHLPACLEAMGAEAA